MAEITVFVATSIAFALLFRQSLRNPRCHGFYRFFGLEAILALFLLNVPYWFADRLAPQQLLSWGLLFLSLFLLVQGAWFLHTRGQASAERKDPALLGFEKTRVLVTEGIFRHIRHPLYGSLLLLAWGILLKHTAWPEIALCAVASGFLFAAARTEERECLDFFGEAYREYMQRSRMFIPGLF